MVKQEPAKALFNGVRVGLPDACWPWEMSRNPQGYGKVKAGQRDIRAHRLSYELHHGPVPAGMVVRHTCDNPPCCNPKHLLLGTHKDNTQDMIRRGRHLEGNRRMTEKRRVA